MAHAILIKEPGGPEVMEWGEVNVGDPGPGEIRLRQTAIGLNYIDVYVRSGTYPQEQSPFTPGMEGAGVVEAVGADVGNLKVGDRVAYAGPVGSYATERLIAADRVVQLPDGISDEQGAAMMLQGLTVQYLLRRVKDVGPDTTMLFHAAAGGVGLIACQWAKHLGATLIGTASSPEKMKLAMDHGAMHMINYRDEDFVSRTRELTGGEGVDVVYDSVGKDTFPDSLDCLKPFGLWATFGAASGPLPPLDVQMLAKKGSLFVTRPTLFTYIAKRSDLVEMAADLFSVVEAGIVKINVNQTYRLEDAQQAHRDLEARKTTGSTVLIP